MVLAQSMGRLQIMLSKWKCLMAKLSFFGWCWKTNFAVFHVLSPPGQIAVCDFEGCLCSLNFSLSHILLRCHSDGSNSIFFCFVFEGNAISEDRLCTDLRSTNLIPITKENICFPHSWAPAPTALLRRYFNSAVTPGENLAKLSQQRHFRITETSHSQTNTNRVGDLNNRIYPCRSNISYCGSGKFHKLLYHTQTQ